MIYIFIGAIFEVYWAWGLKHVIENSWGILSIAVALSISFVCMIRACQTLDVSTAYAIFTGLGASGLVIIDMFLLGFDIIKFILICILLTGIIGIKTIGVSTKKEN